MGSTLGVTDGLPEEGSMSAVSAALDAMTTSGKRVRIHDQMIPVKHPGTIRVLVRKVAKETGQTEAAVWRAAMSEYLTRRGYNR